MTPTKYGFSKLGYCHDEDSINIGWNIPDEPAYFCSLISCIYGTDYGMDGSICEAGPPVCIYIVGKESKNVYRLPGRGIVNAYQIQDNKKIKTYRCLGYKSCEWR